MKELIDFDAAPIFGIPTIDGFGLREGMLIEGPQGWGEFSPPPDCDDRETSRWLTAAIEGGTAEVTVATDPDSLADDVARVEVVRDELGADGRIRLHANGRWTPEEAVRAITVLAKAARGPEFA